MFIDFVLAALAALTLAANSPSYSANHQILDARVLGHITADAEL